MKRRRIIEQLASKLLIRTSGSALYGVEISWHRTFLPFLRERMLKPVESTLHIKHSDRGFTLLEMIIVVSMIAILIAIAVPNFFEARYKAQVAVAISDIKDIELIVMQYCTEKGVCPSSLADVGCQGRLDPWGSPYEYRPITGDPKQKVRKDRNTHPINTDFDLYSRGRDKQTNDALTAKASHDDVIRANNGGFVGLASKY